MKLMKCEILVFLQNMSVCQEGLCFSISQLLLQTSLEPAPKEYLVKNVSCSELTVSIGRIDEQICYGRFTYW